jgi:hypothetical protein
MPLPKALADRSRSSALTGRSIDVTPTDRLPEGMSRTSSRRAAVGGSVLLAALGAIALRASAAAQATPVAATAVTTLLVQSFGRGSLFPTQGDVGVVPYTAILWDAAERGFLSLDTARDAADVASTEAVLSALGAAEQPPLAILLSLAGGASGAIWALRLVSGGLGSDPGAVTYQGEPISGDIVLPWLGAAPPELPDAPQDLGAGYLVVAGLSSL